MFSYAAENNDEVILNEEYVQDIFSTSVFHDLALASQHTSVPITVPIKIGADAYEMANGKDLADEGSGFDPLHPYQNRDPRMKYRLQILNYHNTKMKLIGHEGWLFN